MPGKVALVRIKPSGALWVIVLKLISTPLCFQRKFHRALKVRALYPMQTEKKQNKNLLLFELSRKKNQSCFSYFNLFFFENIHQHQYFLLVDTSSSFLRSLPLDRMFIFFSSFLQCAMCVCVCVCVLRRSRKKLKIFEPKKNNVEHFYISK
jgi:hypothetical protein